MGAYTAFGEPVTFAHRLRTHLRQVLDGMLPDPAAPIWDRAPVSGPGMVRRRARRDFLRTRTRGLRAGRTLPHPRESGLPVRVAGGRQRIGQVVAGPRRLAALPVAREPRCQRARWLPIIITPGQAQDGDLLGLLAAGLSDVLPGLRDGSGLAALAPCIRESPRQAWELSIRRSLQEIDRQERTRVVLLVDQLEELFTFAKITPAEADSFLRAVALLVRTGYFWCLATVRSDFYDRCLLTPALVELMGNDGQFNLLPPDAGSIERMIALPAALSGLRFETSAAGESLDARILAETVSDPEALPLLEYLLREPLRGAVRRRPAHAGKVP